MIVTPYSRRLRLAVALTVLGLVAIYVHTRPTWREQSYKYAREFSTSVSSYFGSNSISNTLYQFGNEGVVNQYHNFSSPCAKFPDTDGILVVMKTGATEAFDKLPTQLLTTLQCLPDLLLFSDMEQQIGPYHIYDVLADVEEKAKAHNNDFDLYRDQKECPVSQKACVDARSEGQKAWHLDKYKFLPMMEKTWRMRPGRDWYIFAEADTYVFWTNMIYWLRKQSRFDPREKLYLGSRSYVGTTPFAHGGSGYVLSGTLLRHLIEQHPGVANQYTLRGPTECCGDLMLAQALIEHENVQIRHAWPMINGEKPSTLPFGPGHWCEPILTMHHMNAEEVSSVWQFEQTRKTDRTLMIKDIYDALVRPKMQFQRQDWDNLSDDVCFLNPDAQDRAEEHVRNRQKKISELTEVEKVAWKSPENCARVCEGEDVPDDDEWTKQEVFGRRHNSTGNADDPPKDVNAATALDTQKAQDSGPSDQAAREAWQTAMRQRRRNRTCFQYRWHDEQCCTARSFKLGAPKAKQGGDDKKQKWISGWHLKGINDWIGAMGDCEPAWKTPEL